MTKKKLLKALIEHYTKAGEMMTEKNWRGVMYYESIESGVCWLLRVCRKFRPLPNTDWIKYWCGFSYRGNRWIGRIEYCNSLSEALSNIETRIFLMTMELESGV